MEATPQLVTALGPDAPDDGPSGRQQRGLAIAALVPIQEHKLGYTVPSQSGRGNYIVSIDEDGRFCTCPDYALRQLDCKHLVAVQLTAHRRESAADNTGTNGTNGTSKAAGATGKSGKESKKGSKKINKNDGAGPVAGPVEEDRTQPMKKSPKRPTYGQNWKAYDAAQEHEEEHFEPLLRALCDLVQQPDYVHGRPRLPISDMIYCIGQKAYSGMSRRRTMTGIRRAHERELLAGVPSNSSITRYMDNPALTPVLRWLIQQSSLSLAAVESKFAVDGTGFASTTYHRWFDKKHNRLVSKAQWVKCHLMCGVQTNIVTSVDASKGNAHDSPYFEDLLQTTQQGFNVSELSADMAYLKKDRFGLAEAEGIGLYIPFKVDSVQVNAKGERHGPWERAFLYYHLHREEFLRHYHLRSNVESTMWMIKSKFGAFVRTKTESAQFNEVLAKVLCHNIVVLIGSMFELVIEPEFRPLLSRPPLLDEDEGLLLAA